MSRHIYMLFIRVIALSMALLTSAACGSLTGQRVTFLLKNGLDRPVRITASAGVLSRTIELAPGQSGDYWFYSALMPSHVVVTVLEPRPRDE